MLKGEYLKYGIDIEKEGTISDWRPPDLKVYKEAEAQARKVTKDEAQI